MGFNPYLEVAIAGLIWGTSGVFIKYLNLSPEIITFIRLAIPTIILLVFLLIKKTTLFSGNNKLIILASSLNALRIFLFSIGFIFSTIGNSIILLYTWPIFATIFSAIFLKEKINMKIMISLFLAFIGILVVYDITNLDFSDSHFFGMSAIVFSALVYAITIIIFKKESSRYSKYESIFYQNFVGTILFLPFVFIQRPEFTLTQAGIALIYGISIGVIGYSLFFSALKKIKASTASFLSYIEVISAVIFGVFFFHETITLNIIVGGLLIILPVALIKKEYEL